MLSIIIPTLNEEDYLPIVLESIVKQQGVDYEIIIADAGSTDATLAIAHKYNCIVAPGGLPAAGRNNGAQVAKGDILFFLDADALLSDNFLRDSLDEFSRRNLDFASFCLHPIPLKWYSYFLVNTFYNKMILALEHIRPHGAMGMIVKKDLFEKLGGYDETITIAEDHELARRAAQYGKTGILRSHELFFSDRRFVKDGWIATGFKYFLTGLHEVVLGRPVRSHFITYQFAHYKKKTKNK